MNKIWFDVTTILERSSPMLPHAWAETAFADYALNRAPEWIRFCRYHASGYFEVPRSDLELALLRFQTTRTTCTVFENVDSARPLYHLLKLIEQHIVLMALRLTGWLPGRLRRSIYRFAKDRRPARKMIIRGCRELWRAAKYIAHPPNTVHLPRLPALSPSGKASRLPEQWIPFEEGDVYLSLGDDWALKDMGSLYEQKGIHGFKVILSCYDMFPINFPHLCPPESNALSVSVANAAWCADEIICFSECARRDLHALLLELGTPVPSLITAPPGSRLVEAPPGRCAAEVAQILQQPYILFVSPLERGKNHETLYRAYTRLVEQGMQNLPYMVFVGGMGWGGDALVADILADWRTKSLIKVINDVSPVELALLYQGALFTVAPSLYDSLGGTVIDSLASGKFCLASETGAMPETGKDWVEYLDPWNVRQWAERLKGYFEHPESITAATEKIRREYRPVTWESTAALIYERANNMAQDEPTQADQRPHSQSHKHALKWSCR